MVKFQYAYRICAPYAKRWYNRPKKNDATKPSGTDVVERLHNLIKSRFFGNKDLYVAIANAYRSSDGTLCLSYPEPDPLSNSGASRRGPLSQLPTEQALSTPSSQSPSAQALGPPSSQLSKQALLTPSSQSTPAQASSTEALLAASFHSPPAQASGTLSSQMSDPFVAGTPQQLLPADSTANTMPLISTTSFGTLSCCASQRQMVSFSSLIQYNSHFGTNHLLIPISLGCLILMVFLALHTIRVFS